MPECAATGFALLNKRNVAKNALNVLNFNIIKCCKLIYPGVSGYLFYSNQDLIQALRHPSLGQKPDCPAANQARQEIFV